MNNKKVFIAGIILTQFLFFGTAFQWHTFESILKDVHVLSILSAGMLELVLIAILGYALYYHVMLDKLLSVRTKILVVVMNVLAYLVSVAICNAIVPITRHFVSLLDLEILSFTVLAFMILHERQARVASDI